MPFTRSSSGAVIRAQQFEEHLERAGRNGRVGWSARSERCARRAGCGRGGVAVRDDGCVVVRMRVGIGLFGEPFLDVGNFARPDRTARMPSSCSAVASPLAASRIGAAGLSACSRAQDARRAAPASPRSVLLSTMRSATRGLLHRLGMRVERRFAVDRIDHGHHAVEPVAQQQIGMRPSRCAAPAPDRRGRWFPAARGLKVQRRLSRSRSSVSSASTRSPRMVQHRQPDLQQHHVVVDIFDQQMVERDLAELVDDDGGLGERRIFQQAVEQRGLAGAEKAGEHRQRDRLGRLAPRARRPRSLLRPTETFALAFFAPAFGRASPPALLRLRSALLRLRLWLAAFFLPSWLAGAPRSARLSGLSAGPVNTTIGGVGSTGGPSTNLPFAGFRLDSMKACGSPLVSPLRGAVSSSSSLSSDGRLAAVAAAHFLAQVRRLRRRSAPARRRCRARASARTARRC